MLVSGVAKPCNWGHTVSESWCRMTVHISVDAASAVKTGGRGDGVRVLPGRWPPGAVDSLLVPEYQLQPLATGAQMTRLP